MTAHDLAALAVLFANAWAAVSGAAAMRAWWPRHPLSREPRSTRVFYICIIALLAAFGGNSGMKVIDLLLDWPPGMHLDHLDDLLWRVLGSIACIGMVWSKLLALPDDERRSWNILTVVAHPDSDAILVRIFNAAARRMRRRREA